MMHRHGPLGRVVRLGVLFALGGLATGGELDYSHFLRTLVDLDRLAVIEKGVTCKQFSSYDRASRYDAKTGKYVNWGANGDSGHYIRVEPGGEAVMAEMPGPGCIVRIWSANPTGRIRFYLDGDPKPTYEWNFADLFRNRVKPFVPPICGMAGRGANAYLPIPYARSCKITADKPHRQYYHIGYKTFPKGTKVKTFRLPLPKEENAQLESVVGIWKRAGFQPRDLYENERDFWEKSRMMVLDLDGTKSLTQGLCGIDPGKASTVAELKGPGTLVDFSAKLKGHERYALRRVLLRIYWDGEERPSVECPVGDFFGTGYLANPYKSLPLGMGPGGGYCYWRMPFRKSARIEAVNEGKAPADLSFAYIVQAGQLKPDTAYFHAKWRREDPCTTFDYPILECEGAPGRYLGCMLSVDNPGTGWWGEGDEKVYVDGEKFPSTFGTGSEDYFGDAWGFRHFVRPFHGCTLAQGPGFSNKWSVYRWHVSDDIPFEKSFRITIENYGRDKDYNSVAYWYQLHPQKDFFESVPVAKRLPRPKAIPGVVEAESLNIPGGQVVDDVDGMDEFSRGKAVVLKGKVGQSFDLALPVARDDVYSIVFYGARGEAHAPFAVRVGDKAVGSGKDAFARSALFRVGKARLAKGEAKLGLWLGADGSLVLDAIRLEPSRKVRGAIEGENLHVVATSGPKAAPEDGRLPWSGDSHLLLPATEPGQSVTVGLPVQAPGSFVLAARLTCGPDYGQVQLFQGDKALGEPIDCYAPKPGLLKETTLAKIQLSPKANAARFEVVGRSPKAAACRVGIDYVRLARVVVEDAIEAESLRRLAVEGGPVGPQGMRGWGGHNWSAGTQLFFRPSKKGAFATLEATVPKDGRYDIDAYYTKAIDYGIVQLHVDGKPLGKPFDGFNRGVIPSGRIPCGTLELGAGKHELKFVVVGKNPAATGFFVGIDCVTLRPAKQP